MVQKLNQIPAEQRWDIATRCADIMPFAYDQAFRKVAPEQLRELDQAEREIWREMGGRKQGGLSQKILDTPPTRHWKLLRHSVRYQRSCWGRTSGAVPYLRGG
ncbi:hypothetical protein [Methanogenium cariaci]|uniref:hypothetical protein n=1 Tax=Methanogenium cariaci TaxID=2197 RepID=UPI0012F6F58B|nr:hypothetical protein [Methanogenium cariaci]